MTLHNGVRMRQPWLLLHGSSTYRGSVADCCNCFDGQGVFLNIRLLRIILPLNGPISMAAVFDWTKGFFLALSSMLYPGGFCNLASPLPFNELHVRKGLRRSVFRRFLGTSACS